MSTETVQHPVYGLTTFLKNDKYIGHWVREKVIWEEYLTKFFHKYVKPGTNVIDVGAFIGLHSLYLTRRCVTAGNLVYAFEPQPVLYKILKENIKANALDTRIQAFPMALSGTSGLVKMAVPKDYDQWENPGGLGFVDDQFQNDQLKSIQVVMMPLDAFQLKNISLMKIDVEGQELQMLCGAKETIARERPVLIVELMGGEDREEARQQIQDRIAWIESTFGYKLQHNINHDYVFCPTENGSR
jgi:FkbM family methyltransferase